MTDARTQMIETMRSMPAGLDALVAPLTPEQLHTPYMAGEWTVAQNVHHLADSHMHAFIRVKSALTAERPTFALYDQDDWAETPDVKNVDISESLAILGGLHARWCALWDSLDDEQWQRLAVHPVDGERSVERFLEIYSAHGAGHMDQIRRTLAAAP